MAVDSTTRVRVHALSRAGYRPREIAERLGIPPQSARNLTRRASKRSDGVAPEVAREWRRREREGETISGIARTSSYSYRTVWNHTRGHRDYSPSQRPPTGVRYTGHPSDDLLWYYPRMAWAQVALRYDVSYGAMTTRLRRRGWLRRAGGGRSELVRAPCKRCGASTAVEDLSTARVCPRHGVGSRGDH